MPVVAVNVWYHVGSRNEQRGKTGFAHLFEHFFFNGSEHYPKGFREAMDDLGANNRNGTTSADRTNFFEDVPVSGLERTLYLEADRLGFLAKQIVEPMLNRERGVVQNEKRQGENQPYGRVFNHAVTRLYPPNHPYSWPTIGSIDDLNAASLQDVQAWYRSFYGPNNCVLSLAGDITPERALALVKKYFDGIPAGPPVDRATQWVPRLDGNVREEMRDQVAQTRVYRFYHAPAWRDAGLRDMELAASVLSGSRSARLDRALVYEQSLATAVNVLIDAQELGSLFVVVATVRDGVDAAQAEREMDRVVGEFVKQGPTDAELQRSRARLTSQFVRGAERLGGFGGRSDILAESLTFDGRTEGYLDRLERISTATASDVRQAAQRWLDAPHYTLTVYPAEARQSGSTAVDRTVLPPLGDPPEVAFPAVQRTQLSNGATVLLVERHTAPLVNVSLAVDAGFAADVPEKAGLASLTLDLMDDGTATRDTFAIVDELDRLGASISTASTLDLSLVRLQALAGQLRPSIDVLADVVLRPSFPQDMLKLAVQRRLAQIGQEKATPTTAAVRLVPPMLYGAAHAYGAPLTGSGFEATVSKLTREDLAGWHRDWFHPSRTTIIVTGDTTMTVVKPELERAFGAWRSGSGAGQARPAGTGDDGQARLPGRSAGRAAVGDRRGARLRNRRTARGSGDRHGDAELRRHRHVAAEPQPAARQGVELRHAGRAAERPRPAAVHRHRPGADRQDEGSDPRGGERAARRGGRPAGRRRGVRQHHAHADAGAARPLGHAGLARERGAADRQLQVPGRLLLDLRRRGSARSGSRTSPTPRPSTSGRNRRCG